MAYKNPYFTDADINDPFPPAWIYGNQPQMDAATAWNLAHLKRPPGPDDFSTPPQTPQDAQRNAITAAMLSQAIRSGDVLPQNLPGGGQPGGADAGTTTGEPDTGTPEGETTDDGSRQPTPVEAPPQEKESPPEAPPEAKAPAPEDDPNSPESIAAQAAANAVATANNPQAAQDAADMAAATTQAQAEGLLGPNATVTESPLGPATAPAAIAAEAAIAGLNADSTGMAPGWGGLGNSNLGANMGLGAPGIATGTVGAPGQGFADGFGKGAEAPSNVSVGSLAEAAALAAAIGNQTAAPAVTDASDPNGPDVGPQGAFGTEAPSAAETGAVAGPGLAGAIGAVGGFGAPGQVGFGPSGSVGYGPATSSGHATIGAPAVAAVPGLTADQTDAVTQQAAPAPLGPQSAIQGLVAPVMAQTEDPDAPEQGPTVSQTAHGFMNSMDKADMAVALANAVQAMQETNVDVANLTAQAIDAQQKGDPLSALADAYGEVNAAPTSPNQGINTAAMQGMPSDATPAGYSGFSVGLSPAAQGQADAAVAAALGFGNVGFGDTGAGIGEGFGPSGMGDSGGMGFGIGPSGGYSPGTGVGDSVSEGFGNAANAAAAEAASTGLASGVTGDTGAIGGFSPGNAGNEGFGFGLGMGDSPGFGDAGSVGSGTGEGDGGGEGGEGGEGGGEGGY